jgi:hypothetical protein
VSRFRRLRVWAPDEELLERLAAGESYRSVGRAYGVAHTTVSDYLRRPEVVAQLGEVRRRQQVERRTLREQTAEERRIERKVRRRARAEGSWDRELRAARGRVRGSDYEVWLYAPRGLTSQERWSSNDELADQVVSAGGGIAELIEATGLPTRLAVYKSIDAQIVVRALRNERRGLRANELPTSGLRRLKPDAGLIARRVAGEPLRQLAADYGVSHTTLSRYFRRDEVKRMLRSRDRKRRSTRPGGDLRDRRRSL